MRACQVKICGIYREVDIDYVNESLPDYVGFIINVPKSHRNVDTTWVLSQKNRINAMIKTVGVFVNATIEEIVTVAPALDVIQLHGNESLEEFLHLKQFLTPDFPKMEYWKAFSVKTKEDVAHALAFPTHRVLLDYGKGEGKTFDWSILEEVTAPYILAGGIQIENVAHAIKMLHPSMIDLSSGVESDGKKDPVKIKNLLKELEL